MMFGSWNSKYHFEFIVIILECITVCSHYLLQNFRFTAVFSFVTILRAFLVLCLSVIFLWPQKENCIFFKYPNFLFYLVLCNSFLNIHVGHPKPSHLFWFVIMNYVTGQKLCLPGYCSWAAWQKLKKLDVLNERNRGPQIFKRSRHYLKI